MVSICLGHRLLATAISPTLASGLPSYSYMLDGKALPCPFALSIQLTDGPATPEDMVGATSQLPGPSRDTSSETLSDIVRRCCMHAC